MSRFDPSPDVEAGDTQLTRGCDLALWLFTESRRSLEIEGEVNDMSAHHDQDRPATPQEPHPLAHLGTPAEMRSANPIPPETQGLRAQEIPKAPYEPPRPRRHGFAGFIDSIAYRVQWAMLSVFGAAELSREKDPIEQLKRRYGRQERAV